jgi:hypothetical protein
MLKISQLFWQMLQFPSCGGTCIGIARHPPQEMAAAMFVEMLQNLQHLMQLIPES